MVVPGVIMMMTNDDDDHDDDDDHFWIDQCSGGAELILSAVERWGRAGSPSPT